MFKSHGERQWPSVKNFPSAKYLKCQHLSKFPPSKFRTLQYIINMMSKMFKDKNMQIQCDVHKPHKTGVV